MEFSLKYYKTGLTITAILLFAGLFDLFFQKCLSPLLAEVWNNYNGILRAPSNTALIGLVLWFHNKYGWKYPILNKLVTVPNMNGRYEGKIQYEFDGKKGEKDCAIEVVQNASKIKINSYFKNAQGELTSSESLVEDIKEKDGFYFVYFFYLNSGSKIDGSLDCHEGANVLKFLRSEEGSKLVGHYFTNRKTQTKGIVEVVFKTKYYKGEF